MLAALLAFATIGAVDEATRVAERLVKLEPSEQAFHEALAALYSRTARSDEAARERAKAAELAAKSR